MCSANYTNIKTGHPRRTLICIVMDSMEGVCVDPGEKEAILEARGPGPPGGEKSGQLASDSGGHSEMAKDTGDGLATSSRDVYAQGEYHRALCSSYTL
jgi:hypothetical protein